MKTGKFSCITIVYILVLCILGCTNAFAQLQPKVPPQVSQQLKVDAKSFPILNSCNCLADTKIVTFYENETIPAGIGISTGSYTNIDGYRYINITVEFEQRTAKEKPVSLGVVFAFDGGGEIGSGRYFNFEENFKGTADPIMITLSGKNSWHGSPHNKSSYTARLPIIGPYIQIFPFNHEKKARKFTIKAYLTT